VVSFQWSVNPKSQNIIRAKLRLVGDQVGVVQCYIEEVTVEEGIESTVVGTQGEARVGEKIEKAEIILSLGALGIPNGLMKAVKIGIGIGGGVDLIQGKEVQHDLLAQILTRITLQIIVTSLLEEKREINLEITKSFLIKRSFSNRIKEIKD